MGMFARMMEGLASEAATPKAVMIDATYLKAHRTASILGLKGGRGRLIGPTKGGMNMKVHAVTDENDRPIRFFMSTGKISNGTGAAALLSDIPSAQWLLGDRGCDADWFRETLENKSIKPPFLGRKS